MSPAKDPAFERRLTRALWGARLVMLWERGARVWVPLVLAAGLIATAGLWGVFDTLSLLAHTVVLALVAITALVFAVRGVLALRWPNRAETRARLEADSRLEHAPLTALDDAQATGDPALWALHRARAAEALTQARLGRPRAGVAQADPMALRYALVIAALLALWARGPERLAHAVQAFRPVGALASGGGALATDVRTVRGVVLRLGGGAVTPEASHAAADAKAEVSDRRP